MKRRALLLLLLALAVRAADAEDAWPRAWTVNLSGPWQITGCPEAPQAARALTVRQSGQRLTLAPEASAAFVLEGSVRGHDVAFSISHAETLHCLPGASRLRFDGVADGARITGTLRAEDDADQAAAITIRLRREFMLSFDDGPLPGRTERVLDALHQLRAEDGTPVRAAFFTVGEPAPGFWDSRRQYAPYELWTHKGSTRAHPELVARMLAAGHLLGNHTAHHAWFRWPRFADPDAVAQELRGWEEATPRAGAQPKLLRPPYLIVTPALLAAARENDYQIVLGSTVGDAAPGSSVEFVTWKALQVLESSDGAAPSLLIFHDIRPVASDHLQEVVGQLLARGYLLAHFDPRRLGGDTLLGGR
jgi:peptidoglycan/xylan/chitin deacetylase (PgdA/CDA1 family)